MTTYTFNRNRTMANLTLAALFFMFCAFGLAASPWSHFASLWTRSAYMAIAWIACGTLLLNIAPYLVFLHQFQAGVSERGITYRQWWTDDTAPWEDVTWQRTFALGTVLYIRGKMVIIPAFLPGYRSLMESIRRGCSENNPPLDSSSRLARTATGIAIRHGDDEAVTTIQDAARVDRREARRLLEWLRFVEGRIPTPPPLWIIYATIAAYYAIICVPLTMMQHDILQNQRFQSLSGGENSTTR